MPVLIGIHLAFGSPPSAGFPMLPDLSYICTRLTAGSAAFFIAVTHAALVPTGSLEQSPGFPPAPGPPLPLLSLPKTEPPLPPHAMSAAKLVSAPIREE